jgi:hypothetical protein
LYEYGSASQRIKNFAFSQLLAHTTLSFQNGIVFFIQFCGSTEPLATVQQVLRAYKKVLQHIGRDAVNIILIAVNVRKC